MLAIPERLANNLTGRYATEADLIRLRSHFPKEILPDWFENLISTYPIVGMEFSLDEADDISEIGVDLVWMTPDDMISEATAFEPGFSVVPQGFLPIGQCARGSGDPFFLDFRQGSRNPGLVRVLHEYAGTDDFPEEGIELVSLTLEKFFNAAYFQE